MTEPVTLREFMEQRFSDLKEIMESKFHSVEVTRDLQATEYERRLKELNGEHDVLATMSKTYVNDDVYQVDLRGLRDEFQRIRDAADASRQKQEENSAQNRRNNMLVFITLFIALVGWAISISLALKGK